MFQQQRGRREQLLLIRNLRLKILTFISVVVIGLSRSWLDDVIVSSFIITRNNIHDNLYHRRIQQTYRYYQHRASISTSSYNNNIDAVNMDSENTNNSIINQFQNLTVSSNILTTLDPCVVLMKQLILKYSDQWKEKDGIYSLAQGVVYWEPPTSSNDAIVQSITTEKSTIHLYSPDEGIQELQLLLQQKIQVENQLMNHNIVITAGANQAYMNCVLTLLSPHSSSSGSATITYNPNTLSIKSDNNNNNKIIPQQEIHFAVIFQPYYFNHVMALQMTVSNERILYGPIDPITGVPDVQWLQQQFLLFHNSKDNNKIQMITITNPCNPTGIVYTKEQLQPIIDLCKEHHCYVILDCTYEYFIHNEYNNDDNDTVHSISSSSLPCFTNADHVIHIFSLSKSYALAGYRIGYMVLPKNQRSNGNVLYDSIMKVQDTIPIAPSRIGQIAAIGALRGAGSKWVYEQIQTLHVGRAAILQALRNVLVLPEQKINSNSKSETNVETISTTTKIIGGSGAMYVMAKLPMETLSYENDIEIAQILVQYYGIAIIPGTYCGSPNWIRICYANLPPHQCRIAAQRLETGLYDIIVQKKILAL